MTLFSNLSDLIFFVFSGNDDYKEGIALKRAANIQDYSGKANT